MNNLRQRFKAKRKSMNISLRKCAELCGVSFSTLARLERSIGEPDRYSKEALSKWISTGENQIRIRSESLEGRVKRLEKQVKELLGGKE